MIREWTRGLAALSLLLIGTAGAWAGNGVVVYQSDFGQKDGAVSAMRGVAIGVDRDLKLFDLTHEIPAYNIWEGAYRLFQTIEYWPADTVFVSVVDPGVGTDRLPIVAKTRDGRYVVTPDNGTLTLVADRFGIDAVRIIDTKKHRLAGSADSATFHGRDVFSYVAAKLAANKVSFEELGESLPPEKLIHIDYKKPAQDGKALVGAIPVLDVQYGNVWSNIDKTLVDKLALKKGDKLKVTILKAGKPVYKGTAPFVDSFGDVPEGKPLLYLNSLLELSIAINMGDFAGKNKVSSGPDWSIRVERP